MWDQVEWSGNEIAGEPQRHFIPVSRRLDQPPRAHRTDVASDRRLGPRQVLEELVLSEQRSLGQTAGTADALGVSEHLEHTSGAC
jgi:hypothetical protein